MQISYTHIGFSVRQGIDYNKQQTYKKGQELKHTCHEWVKIHQGHIGEYYDSGYFVEDNGKSAGTLRPIGEEAFKIMIENGKVRLEEENV